MSAKKLNLSAIQTGRNCMSSNMKLVRYFVKGFLDQSEVESANLVSPKFVYSLNHDDGIDFDKFKARMQFLNYSTDLELQEITSEDDTHFYFDFKSTLPAPNKDVSSEGFAQIIMQNGLIVRVDIHYKGSEADFKKFQDLMKNSATVLL